MPDTAIDCAATTGRTDLKGFISDSATDNPYSGAPTRAWDFMSAAFETFDSAQFAARYLTPMTETGSGTGLYSAAVPAGAQSTQVYHRTYVTGADAAAPIRAGYVNLTEGGAAPTVTDVDAVTPATASVPGGATLALAASLELSDASFRLAETGEVTWSKQSGVGSVNASTGVYTAPAATGSSQSAVIKAALTADSTKSATAAITVPASTGGGGSDGSFTEDDRTMLRQAAAYARGDITRVGNVDTYKDTLTGDPLYKNTFTSSNTRVGEDL